MFNKIEAAIKREYKEYINKSLVFIKNGHEYNPDAGIRCHITDTRWNQYTAGAITRKAAIEYASKRRTAQLEKELAAKIDYLRRLESAYTVEHITIIVEWRRSSVWGYNPTATVTVTLTDPEGRHRFEEYTGHASGCGYDKRSAAVADALNECDAVRAMLCRYANKHYTAKKATGGAAICYGCGYSSIPYFEGGVGVECFRHAFELCGYSWNENTRAKNTDYYTISKRGKK